MSFNLKESIARTRNLLPTRRQPEKTGFDFPHTPSFEDILGMDQCPTLQRYARMMQDIAPVVDSLVHQGDLLQTDLQSKVTITNLETSRNDFASFLDSIVSLRHATEDGIQTDINVTLNPAVSIKHKNMFQFYPVTLFEVKTQSSGSLPPLHFALARHVKDIAEHDVRRKYEKDYLLSVEPYWFIYFLEAFDIDDEEKDSLTRNNWTTDPNYLLPAIAEPLTSVIPEIFTDVLHSPRK